LIESRDSDEELELYERDSVDIANLNKETYHARHRYAEEYITGPRQTIYFVGFDTSRPPFDDLRVRRAFVMAVDRERLADEVWDGFLNPANGGYVPPTIPGHSPGISLPYDPIQARQLMTQAGYPDGQGFPTFEIAYHKGILLEPLVAQWLVNLNVEVTIEITSWENVVRAVISRDIFFMGWRADYPDPDCFLNVSIRSLLPYWKNETYDQLLDKAHRTFKQDDRIFLYQAADKILIDDAVVMPIAYIKYHLLCKPWVKLPAGGSGFWFFKDVIIEPH
jgi:oligopeptide transport system substrate-binding protein